ncbi:MAG: N-formylglutamate amidohydrolase [Hymenobacteraceae bacterium]|nr:N-formylglutamate amidohydrolase [Hymenobacteraceae bacterium]
MPPAYAALFKEEQEALATHRGYDIGALELFQELEELADKSFYAETSRLLVELNRSLHHKGLFSSITRSLPAEEKETILKEHYFPYRERVEQLMEDLVSAGRRVLHVAVHTFTPVLNGEERQADIGLLYDPKRKAEQSFCKHWKQALQEQDTSLLVRYNYPYLGIADGFPTYLRRRFSEQEYIGIELEVNQKFPLGDQQAWRQLKEGVKLALQHVLLQHKRDEKDVATYR